MGEGEERREVDEAKRCVSVMRVGTDGAGRRSVVDVGVTSGDEIRVGGRRAKGSEGSGRILDGPNGRSELFDANRAVLVRFHSRGYSDRLLRTDNPSRSDEAPPWGLLSALCRSLPQCPPFPLVRYRRRRKRRHTLLATIRRPGRVDTLAPRSDRLGRCKRVNTSCPPLVRACGKQCRRGRQIQVGGRQGRFRDPELGR